MPKRHAVLLCLLPCFLWSGLGPCYAQDDGFHWLNNYGEAIREARRTEKPIFLEFRCEP